MQQQGNEPISDKKALDWLEEVVKILALVHGKNYFHRDIKPANIMLRRTGELVLIDFGTARDMAGSYMQKQGQGNLTRISSAGFTPNEQRDGQAVLQSDFFALGRTFTQLLTAKHPLDMYVPAIDEFRWRQHTQNSLSALLDLIDKMMARRPVDRHQDTSALLRDIAKVRKALPVKRTNVQVVKRQGLGRRDLLLLLGGSSFAAIVAWEYLKPKPKVVIKQLQTQTLNNIITVNASGQEVSRTSSTIQYFTEALNLPNGAVPMEMALIPKGKFTMGSPSSEKDREDRESPQHEVNFPQDFYMGRYTITQAQWLAVMGKFTDEFNKKADTKFKGDNRPMIYVNWYDAREFCKKLTSTSNRGTYRLPTEAEWEYACRAGTTTPFHFGETITPSLVNYYGNANATKGEYREQTVDVNNFTPNAWGLHQMHGNVWEWCLDEYVEYSKKSSNLKNNGSEPYGDMTANENDNRFYALRGGCWGNLAIVCRSAGRFYYVAQLQGGSYGLRVVFNSLS
jgi:formylglycine-generating enzyme required for sulfatase activity